jgi:hypothetical protein
MRNPKRMMAATVLICEAMLVFFATLVAYGLAQDRSATYLIVGAVLMLLCVAAAGMLRTPRGYAFGWILQLVIIAGGFIVPMMFGIGAGFAVIWFFAIRFGNKIEREQALVAQKLAEKE